MVPMTYYRHTNTSNPFDLKSLFLKYPYERERGGAADIAREHHE